mmetsp:Transcript_65594/g.170338  ORF Transcript_65594/g.170338 Transcript_65594/m.170338 type:complete len:2438 (+) Transcript_65594:84-7397(+)
MAYGPPQAAARAAASSFDMVPRLMPWRRWPQPRPVPAAAVALLLRVAVVPLGVVCSEGLSPLDCIPRPSWAAPPVWDGEGEEPPYCDTEARPAGPPRRLQRIYVGGPPFFDDMQPPYVNLLVHDSHDPNCDMNYTSPKTVIGEAGYPADGTSAFRKRDMSCGVAIARFVFFTTDKPAYTDESITARMVVKIDCAVSYFLESDTCENVVEATSDDEFGFPRLSRCRFLSHEATLQLATRLKPNTRYDVTLKMLNPPGRYTASENSFHLTTEYYQVSPIIEGTKSPVDMTYIIPNSKDWSELTPAEYKFDWERQRGYITSFVWKPLPGEWFPDAGYQENRFRFEIRTWGVMTGTGSSTGMYYKIMFVAYPTTVWKFCLNGDCRQPKESCDWSPGPGLTGALCDYESFQGAKATEANGFIITIKGTPFENLQETFTIKADNPMVGVNLYWSATSYRYDSGDAMFEPYTVLLNSPVPVLGEASGQAIEWELAATNEEQWLELEFKPGNTLLGSKDDMGGTLVIIPPDTFKVVASARPQDPDPEYNALPCELWPAADREDPVQPRWVCTIADQALFRTTSYRVKLRVQNPTELGAARSWRIELWQFFSAGGWVGGPAPGNRPISVTRSLLGMPVSGTMLASIAPQNQFLGGQNRLRFEFTPSHDIGGQVHTRLKVVAPEGFIIVKRCLNFNREAPMVLPECECQGSDSNTFDLVFTYGDAIKGGERYIFELDLTNPSVNLPVEDNIWKFDTVRPDGVPRDTARYQGFFLFPIEMARFEVVPVTREVGPNPVVVRFISADQIPFDDFITIRAPLGVEWYEESLQFSSENIATNASTIGTYNATIDPLSKNVLTVQLTTAAEANVEYGFRANCIIPGTTPVPNRWWIEQKRQTGLAEPNNWRYLASTGAEGFKSLVLINAVVEPFNVVEEAWENPTLITFEATQPVYPKMKLTASGFMNVSAEVLIVAPPGFTFICPLTPTIYMPQFGVAVPDNVECEIDHNNQNTRNELSLFFPDGIEAEKRYTLTIDLVNGEIATLDMSRNYFRIVTRIDEIDVEDVIVPGFLLAKRMDNTRFWSQPRWQNFFPEYEDNEVTFYIGTIEEILVNTILEIKAPRGFVFREVCTDDVRYPGGNFGLEGVVDLPTIVLCQNLQYQDIEKSYIAHVTLEGNWLLGASAISIKVKNPMRTPLINFWGFTIMNRAGEPLQSEARVYGFQIAVVIDPVLRPYNRGNGVSKEAAINRVELSFELTTHIPGAMNRRNQIVVKAPEGFRFPSICRYYSPGTGNAGTVSLPEETECAGDGARRLILTLPLMRALENKTRYAFRFRVINPDDIFETVDVPDKWWMITTKSDSFTYVDQTRDIPSFPIYERVSFIQIDTLSQVGLNSTTNRFLFRTAAPLPPKQSIRITPPPGFRFGGVANGACIDVDPMIIKRQFDEDYGMKALIAGITRLPEWMTCEVFKPPINEVVITNDEPLLGGRPLINGPVYEFFVMNATNAEETPPDGLNLFRVEAGTMAEFGREEFAGEGWIIYPELLMTSVQTSNPGFGLYTNFTITIQTVSRVPAGGSIRIVAPPDYYFGPIIETAETAYDPLESVPPVQGAVLIPRPVGVVEGCGVLRPPGWACPFELTPCEDYARFVELEGYGVVLSEEEKESKAQALEDCEEMTEKCETDKLSDLVTCTSEENELIVNLEDNVNLPKRRAFRFLVQGYNVREQHAPRSYSSTGSSICFDCLGNTWKIQTRDADTEQTVLDNKEGIPGVYLMGIVTVLSIVPSDTKVGSIENYVTVTLRLDVACEPRATLKITHPIEYMKSANAAFQGASVSTGPVFPRMKEIRQSLNTIEIIAIEESIPANEDMEISIIMSNPGISPSRMANVWTFEASSMRTGSMVIQDVNYNVSGFKIFGEFSRGAITATVLSPKSDSIIGVWFVLKSELPLKPEGFRKGIRIWIPKGFLPNPAPRGPLYAARVCNEDFSYTYNAYREGVEGFPQTIDYFGLPSGSYCTNHWDEGYGQFYTYISIDGTALVDYGLDYAFEFGVTNPALDGMPPVEENIWRLETVMEDVILHLKTGLPGYDLEQIKVVNLQFEDTTKRRTLHPLQFSIMSEKYIPGGSKFIITGPESFQVGCVFFRPLYGLSSTTTCLVTEPNVVEFTIDSQDPKTANTPFAIRVMWTNPEFTPQQNWWRVNIISPLAKAIDVRDFIPGFDVTDRVEVAINAMFAYLGEVNPLRVVFMQYTIMNQADTGNELVLTGPTGFIFHENCTGFHLRLTDDTQEDSSASANTGYPSGFVFPPAGTTCMGFGNSTVIVRLPDGAGLLKNSYTLEIDVENPGYRPNGTYWEFFTRVRNENGTKIVDANRTVPRFELSELVPLRTDEGAALRSAHSSSLLLILLTLVPALAGHLGAAAAVAAAASPPIDGAGHGSVRLLVCGIAAAQSPDSLRDAIATV